MVPGKQAGDSSNQSFFPGQWNFNNQNKFLRQKKYKAQSPYISLAWVLKLMDCG